MKKINRKHLTCMVVALFLCSLLPILALAGTDRASGDDWGYGFATHRAWMQTHSVVKVLQAAAGTVKDYYNAWQGTWFSVFLFTLQPEVFSHQAYWIVPCIMLLLIIAGISCVLYQILVKTLHTSIADYLLINAGLLLIMIQCVPYKTSSIFWYNGSAHYTVPFALALFAIFCTLQFTHSMQTRHIVWAFLWMTLLGGTNYLAAIFALLMVIFIGLLFHKKNQKSFLLAIPITAEIIGLLVSVLAPGNAIRGGETYRISPGRMLWAVLEAFKEGSAGLAAAFQEHTLTIAAIFVIAVILLGILRDVVPKAHLHFPLPGIVILYFFSTYCAMYWPVIFAGVEVSGGVPNMIYWVFVLMLFGSALYGLGWIVERFSKLFPSSTQNLSPYIYITAFIAALLIAVAFRSQLKNTTDYVCYQYMKSGQAADYREQMEQFTQTLTDESIRDAVLPQMNDKQGPLMHMPLTNNPEAWTNETVRAFFGKNSVIAIPRDEWEADK